MWTQEGLGYIVYCIEEDSYALWFAKYLSVPARAADDALFSSESRGNIQIEMFTYFIFSG
jgi:hypothetical protein